MPVRPVKVCAKGRGSMSAVGTVEAYVARLRLKTGMMKNVTASMTIVMDGPTKETLVSSAMPSEPMPALGVAVSAVPKMSVLAKKGA